MIILIIVFILLLVLLFNNSEYFAGNITKFKTPPSFTKLKSGQNVTSNVINTINTKGKNLFEKYSDKLNSLAEQKLIVEKVNYVDVPTFFNCNEKWPGCLPRPLFQGSCGSCWGFASVTCLSSRFFIESCGNSGCLNYPQINSGSLEDVYSNINIVYGFKKINISAIADYIDINKNGKITKAEWVATAKKIHKYLMDKKISEYEKNRIVQVLVYMLDFQSLGSVSVTDPVAVVQRSKKTFDHFSKGKNHIDVKTYLLSLRNQPLNFSAEKLIACCVNCIKDEFQKSPDTLKNNPVCGGGSLEDAWILLRDTGTVPTLCIGYNLDTYSDGDQLYTCNEIEGPYFSFCSGYVFDRMKGNILNTKLEKILDSGLNPTAILKNEKVPWKDPQLFRFRAKNAYTVDKDVLEIQKEIIQRGPVNSGFLVYSDFETSFGGLGLGGQLYKSGNPLGSDPTSLIYMRDPDAKGESTGGHAITIVGWGTFKYSDKLIPYWTCLNSWGAEWGHNGFPEYNNRYGKPENQKGGGYFWIVRGIDNCGIESNVVCGQPNLDNISYPGIIDQYGWGLDSPSLYNKYVNFLPELNIADINSNSDIKLALELPKEGGGIYTDNQDSTWTLKSMDPPSPYLMFWQKNRPTYNIGIIKNDLTEKTTELLVDIKAINYLKILMKVYKNPLLIIDKGDNIEQVQLSNITKNTVSVFRAVNNGLVKKHKKGSLLRVFPYQDISIEFLEKYNFVESSIV